MIMRAKKEGDFVFFELEGHLDFETTEQFEETYAGLISRNPRLKAVFNLGKLKFVGSTNITHFLKTLRDFNSMGEKPRICHVSSEFERIFKSHQKARNPYLIFEDVDAARASFNLRPPSKKHKRAHHR